MNIDPELTKHAPGALGAVSAMLLLIARRGVKHADLIRASVMVLPSCALTFYGTEFIAGIAGMPPGLAGFLLGLCGMAGIVKVLETWEKFDLGGLLGRFLSKLLGLPERPGE